MKKKTKKKNLENIWLTYDGELCLWAGDMPIYSYGEWVSQCEYCGHGYDKARFVARLDASDANGICSLLPDLNCGECVLLSIEVIGEIIEED